MNSKDLGAQAYLAWSDAELGIMGPHAAVDIIHARQLRGLVDPAPVREQRAREYRATQLTAAAAARRGYVDEVISPNETRERLAWALGVLGRPAGERGRVRNIPL